MRDTVQPRVSAPALLLTTEKITVSHRSRDAYVYVRQSTPSQMVQHTESLARQYELRERAVGLGWPAHQVVVIDADLGRSGAQTEGRGSGSGSWSPTSGWARSGSCWASRCRGWPATTPTGISCWIYARSPIP